MAKLLYTIGEVAQELDENVSAVRYWSNYFEKWIKPQRNAKGNRLYHPEDIETLKQVQFLLKNQGLTLEGAVQRLTEDRRSVDRRVKALTKLKEIREQLVAVRNLLTVSVQVVDSLASCIGSRTHQDNHAISILSTII